MGQCALSAVITVSGCLTQVFSAHNDKTHHAELI